MDINTIISDSFNIRVEDIHDDLVITNLEEWDSMAHMFFITKIEESFGVELTGDEIGQMQTVKEIKRILESKAVK
jgi:acyl carrier protein